MKFSLSKISLIIAVLLGIFIFRHYDLQEYLTIDFLKSNQQRLDEFYLHYRFETLASFFGLYVAVTALSLPGAAVLTLAAGALFGLQTGLILVSFASTVGATFAFLSSRFLFRDYVQDKFQKYLTPINKGMEKEGPFYLFTLRLIPLFPFFVINLVMGLSSMKTLTYALISQIGMLPGTFVFVNAGLQLSQIEGLSGILSPKLIASFALLGIFPLVANKMIQFIKQQKIYKNYRRPKKFDYNMVAIGGGSAGLVTAYISAAVKAKVALIEKHKMGGDCLNTGCVPSKAIIKSAKLAYQMKNADQYGLEKTEPQIDFKKVMARVHQVIKKIEPHDSIDRYSKLGVDCLTGTAKIISPWEIEINGQVITTKNITIATGASPIIPELSGIEKIKPLTSENLWLLEELPRKLVVLGGGPIGCEMAQSFNRLGSEVVQIEMSERLMRMEDPEVSDFVLAKFISEGVEVLLEHKALEIKLQTDKKILVVQSSEGMREIEFDEILFAVGRAPNIKGFGLEELGVILRENKTVEANDYMQTNIPNIFVCGDVTGPYQLTHAASYQAWFCAVNGLFGRFKKFKVDYRIIPWTTFCDPEVASVGLNEERAKAQGVPYELTVYGIDDLDRAIAESENHGFVRVLTVPGSDKILGATIVGLHASDLLIEFVAAMKHGFGLNKILGTIHAYPTMSEANKYLAGEWKRKQVSDSTLKWLSRFHTWMR